MTQPQPTPADPFPQPVELPKGPRIVAEDGATGLTFDRAGMEETTTATAGDGFAMTGRDPIIVRDFGCGHISGDECDDECAYWRGVASSEYEPPETYGGPNRPSTTAPTSAPICWTPPLAENARWCSETTGPLAFPAEARVFRGLPIGLLLGVTGWAVAALFAFLIWS